ncbi:LytR/AlgR family response regulator transcription factor [Litchfieldia alkalitelluris]|uniref:LytR/AlgR family response regulator transcription factor n=1 Tax=Litchfieldia alkalitelluris TaxID=304268 RepID=UPI0009966B6E|nr:LytTR family DNA-binding domain-containing protein [Litchfieldia alkalitelluris]
MSQLIRVLIVDDERYSRQELSHLLSNYENIEIIGEAENGEHAIVKSIQLQPDVVFLDIEMPKMNGMETASSLKELKKTPLLVFATAYPNFAVEAFRYEAVDYLVKPFDETRLAETVIRLKKLLEPQTKNEITPSINKLAIEGDEEITYINPSQIMYLYRDDRFTRIVLDDQEFTTKVALKEFESRLKDFSFFRIHKSYLVNLQYVERLIPWFNGAYHLEIKGKKELLSGSRNYVKALRSRLELS